MIENGGIIAGEKLSSTWNECTVSTRAIPPCTPHFEVAYGPLSVTVGIFRYKPFRILLQHFDRSNGLAKPLFIQLRLLRRIWFLVFFILEPFHHHIPWQRCNSSGIALISRFSAVSSIFFRIPLLIVFEKTNQFVVKSHKLVIILALGLHARYRMLVM